MTILERIHRYRLDVDPRSLALVDELVTLGQVLRERETTAAPLVRLSPLPFAGLGVLWTQLRTPLVADRVAPPGHVLPRDPNVEAPAGNRPAQRYLVRRPSPVLL